MTDKPKQHGGHNKVPDLTPEQVIQAEKAASYGLTNEKIADLFGIPERTFYNILERQPELASSLKKGRSQTEALMANNLVRMALKDGNLAANIFWLKTKGTGWKESQPQEQVEDIVFRTEILPSGEFQRTKEIASGKEETILDVDVKDSENDAVD